MNMIMDTIDEYIEIMPNDEYLEYILALRQLLVTARSANQKDTVNFVSDELSKQLGYLQKHTKVEIKTYTETRTRNIKTLLFEGDDYE